MVACRNFNPAFVGSFAVAAVTSLLLRPALTWSFRWIAPTETSSAATTTTVTTPIVSSPSAGRYRLLPKRTISSTRIAATDLFRDTEINSIANRPFTSTMRPSNRENAAQSPSLPSSSPPLSRGISGCSAATAATATSTATATTTCASTTTPLSSDHGDGCSRTSGDTITILGFGSLLSETSSRITFPELRNFRLGRVHDYRRVFGHPTSLFLRRGIADLETLELSSLCVEPAPNCSLVVSVFEVPANDMMENGIPSRAFLEREEEFDIIQVPYVEINKDDGTEIAVSKDEDDNATNTKTGIICAKSTDAAYLKKWGQDHFDRQYRRYGIDTIWGWSSDSGLRPCAIYLRHCVLASQNMGPVCRDSFLDETFLVDRTTTIRQYLQRYPHIMSLQPPAELVARYSG